MPSVTGFPAVSIHFKTNVKFFQFEKKGQAEHGGKQNGKIECEKAVRRGIDEKLSLRKKTEKCMKIGLEAGM